MEKARALQETGGTHQRWYSSGAGPAGWLLNTVWSQLFSPCPSPLRHLGLDSVSLAGSPAVVRREAAGNPAALFWECAGAPAAWQQLKFQPLWFPHHSSPPL